MTEIAYALYAIGLVLVTGVIVMYVKRNPKLSAELQAEFNKLHDSAEALMDHLHLIHQVASAPTAVAFVPLAAPAAPTAPPVAATAPAAPPAQPVNPFVAWKAQGKDLMWIQTWGLQRALSDAEWAQAVAAGYEKPAAPGPDTGPVVDTSAPTLDFSVVQGGIPIKLTGPKTIIGCPDRVLLRIFAVSGDSSTRVDYNATINGVTIHATGIAILDTNQRGLVVNGPTVTVDVDSPGIEFAIQAN